MKVHVPMIIRHLSGNQLLVAVPDYLRPLVMSYEQFEREQRKYGQY